MAITAAELNVLIATKGSKQAQGELNALGDTVEKTESRTKRVGGALLGFGSAITGLFTFSAHEAITFGEQMSNVNSILQVGNDELEMYSDKILALATDPRIGQAPETLAAGFYDIASSGFAGADGLLVLEKSAIAATAGLTTTEVAAKGITAVLNAYGLAAEDAGRVSDIMFQTVNEGVITFDQLSANLGNVLPLANALAISFEEVGAAYAQMTLAGIQPSQAETQIAALMRAAINPTEDLTAAVQAYGYATPQALIASEGLTGFLNLLNTAAGGSSEALFDLIGTTEGVNAALVLGANNGEDYAASLARMEASSEGLGATQTALAKQMEATSFSLRLLRTNVQAAAIAIGVHLEPFISLIATSLTKAIKVFLAVPKPIQKVIAIVTALTGALALVSGGIILFGSQLAAAASLFLGLLGPIALVAAAIGGLWFAWDRNFYGIQDITRNAIDGILGYLDPLTDFLGDLKDAWDSLGVTADDTATGPLASFDAGLAALTGKSEEAVEQMGTLERAMTALDIVTGGLVTRLRSMSAIDVAITVGRWLVGAAVDLGGAVLDWVTNTAIPAIGDLVAEIPGVLVNIGKWIKGTIPDLWNTVMGWFAGGGDPGLSGDGTGGAMPAREVNLGAIAVNVGEWLKGTIPDIATAIRDHIMPVVVSLTDWTLEVGAPTVALKGWGPVDKILEKMGEVVASLTDWTLNVEAADVVDILFDAPAAIADAIQQNALRVVIGGAAITVAVLGAPLFLISIPIAALGKAIYDAMPASVPVNATNLLLKLSDFGIAISGLVAAIIEEVGTQISQVISIAKAVDLTFDTIGTIKFGFDLAAEIAKAALEAIPGGGIVLDGINFVIGGNSSDGTFTGLGQLMGGLGRVGSMHMADWARDMFSRPPGTLDPIKYPWNVPTIVAAPDYTQFQIGANEINRISDETASKMKEAFSTPIDVSGVTSGLDQAKASIQQFALTSVLVTTTMAMISAAFTSGMASSRAAVTAGVAGMVAAMVSGMAVFRAAVTSGMAAAVAAVRSGVAAMVAAASTGRGQMMSAGLGIGAALGQGIASGIRSQLGNVVAAATAVVATAVAAAKAAGGISSPSKVMRDQVGAMLGAGVERGIYDSIPGVERAGSHLVPSLSGSFAGSGGGTASSGPTYVVNVTVQGDVTTERKLTETITYQIASGIKESLERNRVAAGVLPV